jgi:SAM-dependent methyltransferase
VKFKKDTVCPICNIGASRDLGYFKDKLYGNEGQWTLVRCDHCKHESITPILSHEELANIYDVESYYSFKVQKTNKIKRFIRSKTRQMFPKNLVGKRLLDYGCGDGEVLILARDRGAKVFGIEFGENAKKLRESTGLEIESQYPNEWLGTMDYVRSFHSYEHIVDPIKVLEEFKDLVVPNTGRILIGVPNVDSWTASIFGKYYFYRGVPLHLHGYTPESIRLLGEQCGLKVVSISTPGGFRGILGSIHLTLQSVLSRNSREPSNVSLMTLLPLYLVLFPLVLIGNMLLKGDVLEVEFCKHDV